MGRQEFSVEKPESRDRVMELVRNFPDLVQAFDDRPAFTDEQLTAHLETIKLRRAFSDLGAACRDQALQASLYRTLRLWDIGARGSRLVEPSEFERALMSAATKLACIQGRKLADADLDAESTANCLSSVIGQLRIVENKNRVVAGTKCLHHLLPDLVPPMDREYTQTFFGWANPEFQYHPEKCFKHVFRTFANIAAAVKPEQYVGTGWRSSGPKIIDNAIVAFCRLHGLESSNRRYRTVQKVRLEAMVKRAKEFGIYDFTLELRVRLVVQTDIAPV